MAFSQQLEEIIEAALADGVITEKERAVLHKKALQEGVDPDEVDVVIDGRLQQMQNEVDKAKQKVRKCPSCGEIIPAMTAVCPSCGQVIDTSNPDNKALLKYMSKLEAALVKLKENGASKYDNKVKAELESMIRQGRSLYGENKRINYLISEVEASIADFEEKHRKSKIYGWIIKACILLAPIIFYAKCQIDKHNERIVQEQYVKQAEAQCDSLCKLIENLDTPTKSNYRELTNTLVRITWKAVPYSSAKNEGEEDLVENAISDFRRTYLDKKESFGALLINIYREEGEDDYPSELIYPHH